MSTSGLEVVRRYRELVFGERAQEAIAFLSQDLELVFPQGTVGYTELTGWLSEPPEEFDHLLLENVEAGIHELPDGGVLSETDQVYRWKETGEVSNREHRAMLWRVENGKIRYMKFFVKPDDAWAEAGVERP
ncbi:MAG: hypothetical protein M3R37_08875 [Actinomycetota bacterium]|nr:hypothetical protein [Actinomycetota bacterium]